LYLKILFKVVVIFRDIIIIIIMQLWLCYINIANA